MTNEYLEEVFEKYTFQSLDDMYASIGYGGITANQVLNKLNALYNGNNAHISVRIRQCSIPKIAKNIVEPRTTPTAPQQ